MPINSKNATFDAALLLKSSSAVTASGNAQVNAVDRILDLGLGRVDARAICDVTALDVSSGDESYRLRVQLSNSATFAAGNITVASLELGDSTVTGSSVDTVVGRYEIPFANEVNGVLYRYARMTHVIAGTTPTITHSAYAVLSA